ncbi:MAG: putative transposase/invertase (TIGR01784 family) [Clostridium sp.]|jgi:predicted transposase/invertase (TIGR01784 family)
MQKRKVKEIDENFIMSPKYDFVFKYIFGNEKHKDLLIALLSDVLGLPEEEFADIQIINSELLKQFKEDKKGILDIRVNTKVGGQIDIEIQILPTQYMAERTLFYWSKMYTSQIQPGNTYDMLKKCVTINIVDFECTPLKKLYSCYHLMEDGKGERLTDLIEIRFLEIPKLLDKGIKRDENDPIVQWMEFLDGKSKEVMEMLAEKNKGIKKAYALLKVISKDDKAKMLYESRQAEISDELTRLKSARDEKGIEDAINFLRLGVSEEIVAKGTGISLEKVLELKKEMLN